jgi:hypothetical protein
MVDTLYQIRSRRGTMAEWLQANPVLAEGEIGVVPDIGLGKIGDGVRPWAELPYSLTVLSDEEPLPNGEASAGIGYGASREDHVHPNDTSHVKLSGDQMTGPLAIVSTGTSPGLTVKRTDAADPEIFIDGLAARTRRLAFRTNGQPRWAVIAGSNPETGSNAGSDFGVYRYNDAGAANLAFHISREKSLIYENGNNVVGLVSAEFSGVYSGNPPANVFTDIPLTTPTAGSSWGNHPFTVSGNKIQVSRACYVTGVYSLNWSVSGDGFKYTRPIRPFLLSVGDTVGVKVFRNATTRLVHVLSQNASNHMFETEQTIGTITALTVGAEVQLRVLSFTTA